MSKRIFIFLSAVLLVISLITAGRIWGGALVSSADKSERSGMTLAERIQFQDELADQQTANMESGGISLADRIAFQDQLADQQVSARPFSFSGNMTLADRIRFHDWLWEQAQ